MNSSSKISTRFTNSCCLRFRVRFCFSFFRALLCLFALDVAFAPALTPSRVLQAVHRLWRFQDDNRSHGKPLLVNTLKPSAEMWLRGAQDDSFLVASNCVHHVSSTRTCIRHRSLLVTEGEPAHTWTPSPFQYHTRPAINDKHACSCCVQQVSFTAVSCPSGPSQMPRARRAQEKATCWDKVQTLALRPEDRAAEQRTAQT